MLTKKGINQLGSKFNESAGSKVSTFALKQMEKFGWKEGQGLGKNEDGIVKHIKAVKKEENTGIGRDAEALAEMNTEWWHDAFSAGLKNVHKTKINKKRARKDGENSSVSNDAPTFEQLFEATGGARLGMRARASQKGKLLRTEHTPSDSSTALQKVEAVIRKPSISESTTNELNTNKVDTEADAAPEKKKKRNRKESQGEKLCDTQAAIQESETDTEVEKKRVKKSKKDEKKKDKKS